MTKFFNAKNLHSLPDGGLEWERDRHQDRAARVRAVLNAAGLSLMPTDTHIVPLMVGAGKRAISCSLNMASTSNRSTIRPSRAAPSGYASRRRLITMTH
jgi:7-keto-8-aminopelargonate synthetase-like enzyme